MDNNIYKSVDDRPIRVVRKGIASLVTYTNKRSPWEKYVPKQRCVWPNGIVGDTRVISKRVFGKNIND